MGTWNTPRMEVKPSRYRRELISRMKWDIQDMWDANLDKVSVTTRRKIYRVVEDLSFMLDNLEED